MQFYDRLCQRQTQAAAAHLTGTGLVNAEKRLKDLPLIFCRNTAAAV